MVKDTTLYDRLGVSPDASPQELKKAYRTLAKKHHPDRNPDDPTAVQRFQEIEQAFSVLDNEEQRQIYDRFGMEGLSGEGAGFRNPFARRQRAEPEAVIHNMSVSLEDLYCGATKKIQVASRKVCAGCKGKGSQKEGKAQQCSGCDGHGILIAIRQMGPFMQQVQVPCPDCSGQGTVIADSDKCPDCKGGKTVVHKRFMEVNVDKGMTTGSRIMLRGAGDEQPGQPATDIVVVLHTLPHERFTRKNHDLYVKQTISLVEALAGCEVMLTRLDGRKIVVRTKPGEIITPGRQLCVLNEGFPVYRQPFDKGRLIITFDVAFPAAPIAADQIAQIKKLFPSLNRPAPRVQQQEEIDEYTLADVDMDELKKEQEQHRHHDHATEADDEDAHQGSQQGCRVG